MPGQPDIPGVLTFDVTNLEVIESGPPDPHSQTSVDRGETFDLRVTFAGNGALWNFLEAIGVQFRATFFADGIGVPGELNLGDQVGTIASVNAGGGTYEATRTIGGGIGVDGIYKLAVSVQFFFPLAAGNVDLGGVVGFYNDAILQVSEVEQPGIFP